ncbi:MAG: dipeptide ABC transporter ATP-binding protein [Burkholderiaceae bacterium]
MSAPLVEAVDLSRHYAVRRGPLQPKATLRALDGVSFQVEAGRTLAVVGESGCGKSTLARLVALAEPPTAGTLAIAGRSVESARPDALRALRRDVQMVFQNPYASLNPRKRIAQALDEPLRLNTALAPAERRERISAMLARVGLRPQDAQRWPHMFSGGQRPRNANARAMMLAPKLLVADEPTSALDVSIQAQVLNLLMDLQAASGLGLVFISHNLGVVEHLADRVMVMYLGRVVERAPRATLFAQPLHPYTKALLSATPGLPGAGRRERIKLVGELPSRLAPPAGCALVGRCPFARERCAVEPPALRSVGDAEVACHFAEEIAAG